MKLMTLNTHSLIEEDYERKLADFLRVTAAERPDVIALQEVNQRRDAPPLAFVPRGYRPCAPHVTLREGNHAVRVGEGLWDRGETYAWTWLPIKRGYRAFDEGIALLCRSPIIEARVIDLTPTLGYESWKARKILGIRTEAMPDRWFFSVHFGWWADDDTPFGDQWALAGQSLPREGEIWLMGDFNNPAHILGEGYELVASSGWYDSYLLAGEKDDGITVNRRIAGWEDAPPSAEGLRIDQIWCDEPRGIRSSRVIFDGKDTPVVSDHFGVLVVTEA